MRTPKFLREAATFYRRSIMASAFPPVSRRQPAGLARPQLEVLTDLVKRWTPNTPRQPLDEPSTRSGAAPANSRPRLRCLTELGAVFPR